FHNGLLIARPDVVRIQLRRGGGSVIGILPFSIYRAVRSGKPSVDSRHRGDAGSFDSSDASNPVRATADGATFKSSSSARHLAHELPLPLRSPVRIANGGCSRGAVQRDPRSEQSAGST